MLIQRRLPWRVILQIGLRVSLYAGSWAFVVFLLYSYAGFSFLQLPFLPIATIGTAVAFYVGFKNNSAYDRFWEGRKIWGGVVNASRTWASEVLAYLEPADISEQSHNARRDLIYRQLAWINALRLQLRQKSRFTQPDAHHTVKKRLAEHADHMRNDWQKELTPFLSETEYQSITAQVNPATHLLNNQAQQLSRLLAASRLDVFHQIHLMETIKELYGLHRASASASRTRRFPDSMPSSRAGSCVYSFSCCHSACSMYSATSWMRRRRFCSKPSQ